MLLNGANKDSNLTTRSLLAVFDESIFNCERSQQCELKACIDQVSNSWPISFRTKEFQHPVDLLLVANASNNYENKQSVQSRLPTRSSSSFSLNTDPLYLREMLRCMN